MNVGQERAPSLDKGRAVIQSVVKTLSHRPGVYRMYNGRGDVLYVGKAKSLKRRVASYTNIQSLNKRLQDMVSQTVRIEIVITPTETEALLLETNLIGKLSPRYNVLCKEGKKQSYLLLTEGPWPLLTHTRHPGPKGGGSEHYFGPFLSTHEIQNSLKNLQHLFLLRSCSDAVFRSRTRPCLQYDIKRCSAPCVERVSAPEYQELVEQARQFLSGHSSQVQEQLAQEMEAYSLNQDYERAAVLRDRVQVLRRIQSHRSVYTDSLSDADVWAIEQMGGESCVQILFFRNQGILGTHAFFPTHDMDEPTNIVLQNCLMQFYEEAECPPTILLNTRIPDQDLVVRALRQKHASKTALQIPQRGGKRRLTLYAAQNAREALLRSQAKQESIRKHLERLCTIFRLTNRPRRIEVYDNSHLQGTYAIGVMIVAGPDGFMKSAYRRFSIKRLGTVPGDDLSMMREVLSRRFRRVADAPIKKEWQTILPDLIFVDGGQAQLNVALEVLHDLGFVIPVIGIAKGPDRHAGHETFFQEGRQRFQLDFQDPTLYYLQRLRDEAHRYAIAAHRKKRTTAIRETPLRKVPGVGTERRRSLLRHFGSFEGVKEASIEDLRSVAGIQEALARKIYDFCQRNV